MILVCGVPRSGTTWIAKILSQPRNVSYYHEPDNEHNNLLAYIHKQNLPRFPYLTSENNKNGLYSIYNNVLQGNYMFGYNRRSLLIKKLLNININEIEKEIKRKNEAITSLNNPTLQTPVTDRLRKFLAKQCYRLILTFKKSSSPTGRVIIKSVHSILALSFLQTYFDVTPVIVIRHPANVVASHLKLDNPDIWRNIFNQKALIDDYFSAYGNRSRQLNHPLEKAGVQVAAFYYVISKQLESNPDWLVVKHEEFCLSPIQKFKNLYKNLNLEWSQQVQNKISELNKNGEGYSYKRKAREQIDKWKRRLNSSQIHQIKKGYSIFPVNLYKKFRCEPKQ